MAASGRVAGERQCAGFHENRLRRESNHADDAHPAALPGEHGTLNRTVQSYPPAGTRFAPGGRIGERRSLRASFQLFNREFVPIISASYVLFNTSDGASE